MGKMEAMATFTNVYITILRWMLPVLVAILLVRCIRPLLFFRRPGFYRGRVSVNCAKIISNNQKRAHDKDGNSSSCFENREDHFPHRCNRSCFAYRSLRNSACWLPYAW